MTPNDVVRLISIQAFPFNFCNQFFNLDMRIYEEIEKSIHESKFFHQKKLKRLSNFWLMTCFVLFFFSINFLNLKTNHFFLSIINMRFHITGSYTSEKINHSNTIDCPKYLNKNQALFRHKSHMIAELCLIYIFGIQTNWENWKKNNRNNLEYTENIPKSVFTLTFRIW